MDLGLSSNAKCRFLCSIIVYLENILLWYGWLQVLDEHVGLGHVVLLQVVDHEVQACLGDHVHERGQHLHVKNTVLWSVENGDIIVRSRNRTVNNPRNVLCSSGSGLV